MFCAFFDEITIALGVGVGAVRNHSLIKEMRDDYDTVSFINPDGTWNRKPNTYYQEKIFKKNGFQLQNCYQKVGGVVTYPTGVFLSEDNSTKQVLSDLTIAIHHGAGTWQTPEEAEGRRRQKMDEQGKRGFGVYENTPI